MESPGPRLISAAGTISPSTWQVLALKWISVMSWMRGASRHPDSLTRLRMSSGAPQARHAVAVFSFMLWHHWNWMRSSGAASVMGCSSGVTDRTDFPYLNRLEPAGARHVSVVTCWRYYYPFLSSRAAAILWGRLATCGGLSIRPPAASTMLESHQKSYVRQPILAVLLSLRATKVMKSSLGVQSARATSSRRGRWGML